MTTGVWTLTNAGLIWINVLTTLTASTHGALMNAKAVIRLVLAVWVEEPLAVRNVLLVTDHQA